MFAVDVVASSGGRVAAAAHRVHRRQSSQFYASSSSSSSSLRRQEDAFCCAFLSRGENKLRRRSKRAVVAMASSKKRPKKQRENIYTQPDIGTTPYQMKDDLPAVGPEFDLSQKKQPEPYFGAAAAEKTATGRSEGEIDMSPEMFDKLINIFRQKNEEEWIGLLASSEKWYDLCDGLFARIEERVEKVDEDPAVKNRDEEELLLARLLRKLKETHARCTNHRDLLEELMEKDDDVLEGFVPSRRGEFTAEFFGYMTHKIERANEMKDLELTANLARIASRVLGIVEQFDEASRDQQLLDNAAENFQELLKVDTIQDMDAKIDELASTGKLDPALMLTAAKAYMSVKESPYVEEEVKDVMVHLYSKMRDTVGRQQPKEVRILKLVLSVDDPIEQRNMLEQAFTPGPELENVDGNEDMLWCTPENMLQTIEVILRTREQSVVKTSLGGDAARMMTPEIIERMQGLKNLIEDQFM
jgi:hypothetical protein